MAYTTANLNLILAGFVTSPAGTKGWLYTTTDAIATVLGASYISNAIAKGMSKGDYVFVVNTATPSFWVMQVSSVSSTAATLVLIGNGAGTSALPVSKFTSISAGNGTSSAGDMEGAQHVALASSGATAFTTRTAAQIIAAIPNMQIGDTYRLHIFNSNGGTLTLTGGTGVTITGTATIATNITRDYEVKMTGAATITMQNLGAGVAT